MSKRLKVCPRGETGRLRPHQYTSYFGLALLLIIAGIPLTILTVSAASPGPQAGSVSLTGVMTGHPPTKGATITQPTNNQHFSTTPITVSGSCPANTLVEIFKNKIFAGSSPCTDGGTYSLKTDLMIGQNILDARVYDALNQAGPDSNQVIVYYDAVPPQASGIAAFDFGGDQLLLNTDAVFRGNFPQQKFNIPISLIGGTPPYAVSVQWGDNGTNTVPRKDNATFNIDHAYDKAGTYQISIQATDSKGLVAFLTVASIINGQPPVAAATTENSDKMSELLLVWPLYAGAAAVVVSFWLGEQREKRLYGIPAHT